MQLVIAGLEMTKNSQKNLDGFKYRADVHLHDEVNEVDLKKIWSAAYALLQPEVNIRLTLLNSFNMHVPVITIKKGYPGGNMMNDAVLYAGLCRY